MACDICWYWWSVDSDVFSRQSLIPLRAPVAVPKCEAVVVLLSAHVCKAVDDHTHNPIVCMLMYDLSQICKGRARRFVAGH